MSADVDATSGPPQSDLGRNDVDRGGHESLARQIRVQEQALAAQITSMVAHDLNGRVRGATRSNRRARHKLQEIELSDDLRNELDRELSETEHQLDRMSDLISGMVAVFMTEPARRLERRVLDRPVSLEKVFSILEDLLRPALRARAVQIRWSAGEATGVRIPDAVLIGCLKEICHAALYVAEAESELAIACATSENALRISATVLQVSSISFDFRDLWRSGGVPTENQPDGAFGDQVGLYAALRLLQPYGCELSADATTNSEGQQHRTFSVLFPNRLVT